MIVTNNNNNNNNDDDTSHTKTDSQQTSSSGQKSAADKSAPADKSTKSSSSKSEKSTTPKSDNKSDSNSKQSDNSKQTEQQKADRFEGEGVVFKAKLIGSELVIEPRGDKMCQNSITRLKAIIKGTNSHKRRIVLKISFSGVKVYDEKTNEILHDNEVSQISYIASDDSDTRCFGYVCDVPSKAHQFICFKTSGPAVQVMSAMSALFDAVAERKKVRNEASASSTTTTTDKKKEGPEQDSKEEPVTDLILGDLSSLDEPVGQVTGSDSNIGTSVASGGNTTGGTFSSTLDRGFSFDDGFSDMTAHWTPSLAANLQQQQQQQQQQHRIGVAGRALSQMSRTNSNSLDLIDDSGIMDNTFGSIDRHQQQQQQQQMTAAPPIAIPTTTTSQLTQQQSSNPTLQHQSSLQQQHYRRHNNNNNTNNRSLIYNHSSKSLSDAMFSRQSPVTNDNGFNLVRQQQATSGHQQQVNSASFRNDGYVDRYAVFNDIDNLPSIFESTSLNSLNGSNNNSNINISNAGNINSNIINTGKIASFARADPMSGFQMNHNNTSAGLSSSFASTGFAGSGSATSGIGPSMAASAHQWFSSSVGDAVLPSQIVHGAHSNQMQFVSQTGAGSNQAAATHQWLNSSTASIRSANSTANDSTSNVFRQTNPFDEEFFS